MGAKDVVKKLVDAVNHHDGRAVFALYSPGAVETSPILRSRQAEGRVDKEQGVKVYESYFVAFPDLKIKISDLIAKGDVAWFEFVFAGTHKGPFQTSKGVVPPTNKPFEWTGAWFVRTRRNLIVESSRFYDLTEWNVQLGLKAGS
jgi:predicted ester cyclase